MTVKISLRCHACGSELRPVLIAYGLRTGETINLTGWQCPVCLFEPLVDEAVWRWVEAREVYPTFAGAME